MTTTGAWSANSRDADRPGRGYGQTAPQVYVDTPLAECELRDPKGLYARARVGELRGMTGVDDPYEPPTDPDVRLVPETAELAVDRLVRELRRHAVLR